MDAILGHLIDTQQEIDIERVAHWLKTGIEHAHPADRVVVPDVDLRHYDALLSATQAEAA